MSTRWGSGGAAGGGGGVGRGGAWGTSPAAVVYTRLVLSAALRARGTARGPEGIVRAVLTAGILLAPAYSPGTHILLLSPDHTGIAVPILLTLLFVDRAEERWWVPPLMCMLLTWAQLDDPLATFAAA